MARTFLTSSQREAHALDERARWLANGLNAYKARESLSLKTMGSTLGISDKTMARILDGDHTVRISVETLWRLESIARRTLTQETEV